jgi:hypothetical protein
MSAYARILQEFHGIRTGNSVTSLRHRQPAATPVRFLLDENENNAHSATPNEKRRPDEPGGVVGIRGWISL